jgi:hypothetical protein
MYTTTYDPSHRNPMPALRHATGNGVAAGSGFGAGFLARLHPDRPLASRMRLPALAVLGLVAIAVTRARLGASRRRPTPATDPDARPRGLTDTRVLEEQ